MAACSATKLAIIKASVGYDDSLDVVGVHGIGGTWGALATGLFASKAINPAGNDGLFYGNPVQLAVQAITVAATITFAFVVTLIILSILKAVMGLRVTEEEERMGLDLTQHNERGLRLITARRSGWTAKNVITRLRFYCAK